MKISAGTIGWGIAAFVWSIFMGVTAISIGVGAAFPPANLIAKPFVCPNGQMTVNQETSNPLPGTTYTTVTWYCVDAQTGVSTQLDMFPMSLYAGAIYGLLVFVVVAIIWAFAQRRSLAGSGTVQSRGWKNTAANHAPGHNRPVIQQHNEDAGAMARMSELKKLRAADMISEAEYQQKRAEILKKL
jgi:hypothetical protein